MTQHNARHTAKPPRAPASHHATPPRDSHGRFEPDHHRRTRAIGAAAAVGAVASLVGAALHFGLFDRLFAARPKGGEHPAPDLAPDQPHPGPDHRAPVDFRPDPTAPVPASERDSLRPATGPAPSLVEDRGAMRSETAPANG